MANPILTDAERVLIAAAVDGELDPRQEAEFRRLLAESPPAGTLYRRLLADQQKLRSLPPIPAPLGLAEGVLERLPPARRAELRLAAASHRAGLIPYVLAASVFLAVAVGSFWVFVTNTLDTGEGQPERLALPRTAPEPDRGPRLGNRDVAIAVPESLPLPREARPKAIPIPDPGTLATLPPETEVEAAPFPRSTLDVVGSRPAPDSPSLTPTLTRLPLLASVAEFDRPEIRTRLLDDLGREPAHRLDLFVLDSHRAIELFQAAARATGVTLAIDATAQERIKRKIPSTWMVYTESLTAEEIAKLLGKLAELARGERGSALVTAHLVPAQAPEARDLRDLLGLDAGFGKRPKAAVPRSIADGTVDQLTANLKKGKTPAKPAILVTYFPVGQRLPFIGSKEVKAFVERREDRRPNQLPLVVVIRPAS